MYLIGFIYLLFGMGVALRGSEGEEPSIPGFITLLVMLLFWPVVMGYEIHNWLLTYYDDE